MIAFALEVRMDYCKETFQTFLKNQTLAIEKHFWASRECGVKQNGIEKIHQKSKYLL